MIKPTSDGLRRPFEAGISQCLDRIKSCNINELIRHQWRHHVVSTAAGSIKGSVKAIKGQTILVQVYGGGSASQTHQRLHLHLHLYFPDAVFQGMHFATVTDVGASMLTSLALINDQ